MNHRNLQQEQAELAKNAGIAAIAAASKTPFSTAFKITLGIGLGNLTSFVLGLGALGVIVTVLVGLLRLVGVSG